MEGNPFFGKKHKPESIAIMAKKVSQQSKRLWQNPIYRNTVVSHTLKALMQKPTMPEKKLMEITNKHNLPFRYVGNGEVVINGLNPDFIDTLGLNLLIEVFGDYWHNRKDMPSYQKERPRSAIFEKAGYKLLVIWEHELYREPEESISNRIQDFVQQD